MLDKRLYCVHCGRGCSLEEMSGTLCGDCRTAYALTRTLARQRPILIVTFCFLCGRRFNALPGAISCELAHYSGEDRSEQNPNYQEVNGVWGELSATVSGIHEISGMGAPIGSAHENAT